MTISRFDGAELVEESYTDRKPFTSYCVTDFDSLYKLPIGYIVVLTDDGGCHDSSHMHYLTYCHTPEDVKKVCPELYDKAFGGNHQ